MAEKKPQRVVGVPIWGIFLLFLGVVFLLQTFDVLPWGLWGTLWRFWPVLIIIIGLGILLRRYHVWLVSLLALAILGACLGIAIWQYSPSLVDNSHFRQQGDYYVSQNFESAENRIELDIDCDAGRVQVR